MPRIYLDSNIYRYLKKDEENKLSKLQEFILKEDNLHIFFSSAHLFDLGRDKTHHKYDDLKFMEQFTGKNYIHLPSKEEFTVTSLATPSEAFESIVPDPFLSPELDDVLDILKGEIEDPEIRELMNNLMNMPLSSKFLGIDEMDDPTKESMGHYLPSLQDDSTVRDLVTGMIEKFKGFQTDPKLWRNAIKSSQQGLQIKQNYNIDINTINFNEELKKTPLATTFIDFVKTIESAQNPKEKQKEHSFHVTAYNALNILGLDFEKKINFASSLDDAEHSFFAAHCDYFIVDDKQLSLKAKVLYKLLGIDTIVLSLEEFLKESTLIKFNSKKINQEELLKNIQFELKNAFILDTPSSFVYPRDYIKYKPIIPFFLYFNRMDEVKDDKDGVFVVLYRETNNYSRFMSYEEFKTLTNIFVDIFGTDDNLRGEFTNRDKAELKDNKWQGRAWTFENTCFVLEINEGSNKLSFLIFSKNQS